MSEGVVERKIWRMAASGKPMEAEMSCTVCPWTLKRSDGPRGVLAAQDAADEHDAMHAEEYEGLYCTVCGARSGNTDQCVPCAVRALERDQIR